MIKNCNLTGNTWKHQDELEHNCDGVSLSNNQVVTSSSGRIPPGVNHYYKSTLRKSECSLPKEQPTMMHWLGM